MARIDEAIEYLNDLRRGAKFNSETFENISTGLSSCASRKGLAEDDITGVLNSWLNLTLPITKWTLIGQCLVPEQRVSDAAVRQVIHWVLTNHAQAQHAPRVTFLLHWLASLMEFSLLNIEVLDLYYDFFFALLHSEKYTPPAGKLVYKLTKSHDVKRCRVLLLQELSKTRRQVKHCHAFNAILTLFKSYRPECVPENVPSTSVHMAFPKLSNPLIDRLHQAQMRCQIEASQSPENRLIWWTGMSRGKHQSASLLPDLEYIQLGSSLYRVNKDNQKKCLDFDSSKELMVHHLQQSIEIPANILSLLANNGGLHIIQYSDADTQARFSQTLYHVLYENFLQSRSDRLCDDKMHFLKRVAVLQMHLLQSIPVVSRFLAQYIMSWNGLDYMHEILSLMEWITFDSYKELYDCILDDLEALFHTSDVPYQCIVLETLKNMYLNIHESMTSDRPLLFLHRIQTKEERLEVLNCMLGFFDDLCEKALLATPDCSRLRDAFLDVYSAIADVQLKSREVLAPCVPMSLAYGVFCSCSAFQINKITKLFLKYKLIYNGLEGVTGNDVDLKRHALNSFSTDFMNSLWFGKSLSWREEGFMLRQLSPGGVQRVQHGVRGADRLLNLRHHVAFAPYTASTLDRELPDSLHMQHCLDVIAQTFPDIAEYISTVRITSDLEQSMT